MPMRKMEVPVTFEKGLLESQEDSLVPEGFLTECENWVPEPTGALRVRRQYRRASTTGTLPATRRTRAIQTVAVENTYATPTLQQQDIGVTNSGTTTLAAWPRPTTTGSLLLAAVTAKAQPKRIQSKAQSSNWSTNATVTWDAATTTGNLLIASLVSFGATVATPSGWAVAVTRTFEPTPGTFWYLYIFYRENAPSQTSQTFTASTAAYRLIMHEYSGIVTSGAFDVGASAAGSGATAHSGTTATTADRDELLVAFLAHTGVLGSPTNGFTEVAQVSAGNAVGLEKIVETTGTHSTSATASVSGDYIGGIAAFRAVTTAPTITPSSGWAAVQTDTEGPTRTTLYHIVNATSRSGTESFTLDRNSVTGTVLLEYAGGLTADAAISAVASGTSTSPSVTDTDPTSPASGQRTLVIGVLGSGTYGVEQSNPTDGMTAVLAGGRASVYSEITTASAAQSFGVTLASSTPWVAILTAYESGVVSNAGGFIVAAHDNGTTGFDLYGIDRDAPFADSWRNIDLGLAAADRGLPPAMDAGLARLLTTHPDFAATRAWDGNASTPVTAAPRGRTLAFYRNRYFIGGTKTGAFGANGTNSNPSRLWFSDLGSFSTWSNTSFVDVNREDGEAIVDIGAVEDGLLIAKQNSLWFLAGSGPDNFRLTKLNQGGGFAGRSICVNGYGAIIAGLHHVWQWNGGAVQRVSSAIEGSYRISGRYVSTACIGPLVFITDGGTGHTFVFDVERETWWIEHAGDGADAIAVIYGHDEMVMVGPQESTTRSLLALREEPGGARMRDATVAQHFIAATGDLRPGGPVRPMTPRHLYLTFRQRGGDADDSSLFVTPYYDGVAGEVKEIKPRDGGDQLFRERIDLSTNKQIFGLKVRLTHDLTTANDALFDIEGGVLFAEVGEPR